MVRIKVLKIYKLNIYKILDFMFKIKSSFAKNQLVNSQTKISVSSRGPRLSGRQNLL